MSGRRTSASSVAAPSKRGGPLRSWLRLLICVGAALVGACGGELLFPRPGRVCPDVAFASIVVAITDSISGVGLAAGASLILQDGAYIDSVVFGVNSPVSPGGRGGPPNTYERTGTYDVRVRRPDYLLWERRGVRVLRGECNVETVFLEARLQRTP